MDGKIIIGLFMIAALITAVYLTNHPINNPNDLCKVDADCKPIIYRDPMGNSATIPTQCCAMPVAKNAKMCATESECRDGFFHV